MSKKVESKSAALEDSESDDDVLPAYSAIASPRPTAESPFNFPSGGPPLALASTSSSASASASAPTRFQRPIAIPQIAPDRAAPFLDAYARPLLQYGITPGTWRAFLSTLSAFLAARVSEKVLAHAANIGRNVSNVPKRFGQGTVEHAKSVGQSIQDAAKSSDYVGAAVGIINGAISLPLGTAMRAVGATMSLPGTAISAVTQKPQTPRERAAAYTAAANEKWLRERGLRAQLVDTAELARMVGLQVTRLLYLGRASSDRSAATQIEALKEYISELETSTESTLELGANNLWLIISQDGGAAPAGGEER